ncbi:hypothetical protein [Nonlabens spongiae]|uniref:hypothetical protein n=1 Tax=Nonlabens spongiae TaxID=331648 RepID=UPI0012F4A3CF|nr:hypothetical protein [Nonlabens spongiae]
MTFFIDRIICNQEPSQCHFSGSGGLLGYAFAKARTHQPLTAYKHVPFRQKTNNKSRPK